MSLVQIAYQTILSKLRDWARLQPKERIEVLQQAASLMGHPFRQALYLLQQSPQDIQISDFEMFYALTVSGEKNLLFKSHSKARLNDCTCKSSWLRKTGEKAPFMCIHQIMVELILCIFPNKKQIEKVDCQGSYSQLEELLNMIS